jgi:hypothetical protein
MKAKYALEAVIYEYDPSKEEEIDKVRSVPQDRVVASVEGTWKGQITWKKKGDKVSWKGDGEGDLPSLTELLSLPNSPCRNHAC